MQFERIVRTEAITLFRDAPLLDLMERGLAMRSAMHPDDEVTFVMDTNPNYTNVCVTDCTFCGFYRKPGDPEAYTLGVDEVVSQVSAARELGATTVLLQGGHNPRIPFEYYLSLIETLRKSFPGIHLHLFSPSEIIHMANTSGQTCEDILQTFWDMGVRTMPGGGAEILVDSVRRKISPKKISAETWLDVMQSAHVVGMKTTATMTYGHRETDEDIIDHLLRIRELQDETDGFYAFIPWSFKPGSSPLSKIVPEEALPSLYIRVIALSRLVLDNVPHIQASWFGEGWRAGQLALHAGADDFGGLLLEENVLYQAQHRVATSVESVITTIREAGFTPVQRTTLYDKIKRYSKSETAPRAVAQTERLPGVSAGPVACNQNGKAM